jgi:hypothetical protein
MYCDASSVLRRSVAIGEYASDEREHDDRELLQERIEAEKERGIGQREDQPVLCDDLHPRADRRAAGADPLNAEVAITEGRQHPAHASANRHRSLGLGVYSHVSSVTCLSNQARTAFVIGVMEFGAGLADTAAYEQKEFRSNQRLLCPREHFQILKFRMVGDPADRSKDLPVLRDRIDHPFGRFAIRLLQAHDQIRRQPPVRQRLLLATARIRVILSIKFGRIGIGRRRVGTVRQGVSKATAFRHKCPYMLRGISGVVASPIIDRFALVHLPPSENGIGQIHSLPERPKVRERKPDR